MKKTILILSLLTLYLYGNSQPLPVKKNHEVIIDTDCAIDDMRAISFMLSRPEIIIKGIITSDGSVSATTGFDKVCSLLHDFNKDDIPVAAGKNVKNLNPAWRQFNMGISWGTENVIREKLNASDFLPEQLRTSGSKIILVCLGGMKNIAEAIKNDPSITGKIERIVWYNDQVSPIKGFNYECDRESADAVIKSRVRIDIISNITDVNTLFDIPMFEICKESGTRLSNILTYVFSQPDVYAKMKQDHFRLNDDLVSVYLTNPELFGMNIMKDRMNIRYNEEYDLNGIKEVITDMIKGMYVSEHNIVFNRFPVQREMFNYDIRPIIDSAISRYGYEEWKANVMTDEFHGHLGVFSIVGAKMGIKAREIFGVGHDELVVISDAGSKPPYSCLNDGIQVSTGATVGMGTIHLSGDSLTRPSAVFTYKNRAIRMTLKNEYLNLVDADINEGIIKYGLMDDGYWKLVRKNAIRYWLEWDRNEIFDITYLEGWNK
jgi:pyrimidine-specific ribonucleoside hydrolase